jgi:hypothetical protein
MDRSGSGWARIGPDRRIADWAIAAHAAALAVLDASHEPWRCGGTWFVGVDVLPNGPDGALGGVAFPWAALSLEPEPLHQGQLSVIRSGYPQPSPEETPTAFAYRTSRDAAHLDGLLAIGAARARMVREPHGWILGLPLNDATGSPLVVWDGSHEVMRRALQAALAPHPPNAWSDIDLTEAYTAARREVFATCQRIVLPVRRGEATLLHRLAMHGVAAWQPGDEAPPEGRMIVYFRPQLASVADWLTRP